MIVPGNLDVTTPEITNITNMSNITTRGKTFIATNNFPTFWTSDTKYDKYNYFSCRELCLAIDFLIDNIYVRFGDSVFREIIGIPMGTNSAPLLADLFLHTFEYDFMLRTMKQDMNKAVQFSNTFRYIDDLFSVNNEHFGHQRYLPIGTGAKEHNLIIQ